ncbi:carboxypeptidase-like regulatory domain-containing protein [Paludisphaera rhizosphaerae]|uniref:carboxypeptidase-like regulatory domain-containing protein n=1 Tax=Paludisphaera rhizosphaerae TaxID=2711216 RepID=UPI0013ECD4CB|nr:carboxypeptidase-like regulatory domain-containing protein [Paludisphaera rhizosphaerae]
MKHRMKSLVLGSSLMILAVAGCGGPTLHPVTGTITQNGEPLAEAAVMFLPEDPSGLPAQAVTGPDGKYTLTTGASSGATAGKFKVAVSKTASNVTGDFQDDPFMASMAPDDGKKKKPTKGGPVEATFDAEVVAGKNEPIDYDVKVAADSAKP